jgi:RNA polymerase sigma factor (sigma-70 family)
VLACRHRLVAATVLMTDPTDLRPPAAPALDFESFYRSRWAGAVRVARLLVGREAIAEEVAQDVFLGMRRRWDAITTPDAYLRRSLVNRSHNALRRATREVPDTDAVARTAGEVAPPEVDELWQHVLALPDRHRAALVLRFYEDLSEAAIADALGCRPGTVKSLLHRGLAKLREQLA